MIRWGAISFLFLTLIFSVDGNAQEKSAKHKANVVIPEVALLALHAEGSSDVGFYTSSPNVAGSRVEISKNENTGIWINYSSIIKPNQKRKITATVLGEIPEGLVVKLQASESRGNGKGHLGKAKNSVVLSNGPADVVSDIGSCYTGKGTQNGHLISYELEMEDPEKFYNNLSAGETHLSVVYTLTDDN